MHSKLVEGSTVIGSLKMIQMTSNDMEESCHDMLTYCANRTYQEGTHRPKW